MIWKWIQIIDPFLLLHLTLTSFARSFPDLFTLHSCCALVVLLEGNCAGSKIRRNSLDSDLALGLSSLWVGEARRDVADGSHSWVTTVITISSRCDQYNLTFSNPNPERKNLKRHNIRHIMRRKYIWIFENPFVSCIYPSQRHNLPLTLEITTHDFKKCQHFLYFSKYSNF